MVFPSIASVENRETDNYGGRVPEAALGNGVTAPTFSMFEEGQGGMTGQNLQNSMQHFWQANPVSNTFLSQTNIDNLQDAIRYQVWKETNKRYVISRQSDTELAIIMRGMLLKHARNNPANLKGEVMDLNKRVLDFCIPRILTRLTEYLCYRRDVSEIKKPMERSAFVDVKGSKTLELKRFF